MKKRQLNLPAGHHDADSASELLGISKVKLLQHLREAGFLDTDKKNGLHGNHNLPRQQIKDMQWAYVKTLTYGSGANKQINREYRIAIFTEKGFKEVKKIIADPEGYEMPNFAKPKLTPPPSDCTGQSRRMARAKLDSASRKALLDQMADWGLSTDQPAH
ncbi:hypothetical protein HBA55_35005 [Pseudomaricurvus alkylphenolicus]|uniref:hypothetical protein n=1 Tax=Pseudomaricurvus alkylphenolicus TaxID=1306991 RepID=UPI001420CF7E|nr:hypothetical protein [Pseudomaricurvus alkylphenolicus]NIB44843.1 hypothetical protein [Pseudomaricurvus alkylphenolicus]